MPRRAPGSDVERWQQQLQRVGQGSGRERERPGSPSPMEAISELTNLITQLTTPGDVGPELFRWNDRANELLRHLPAMPKEIHSEVEKVQDEETEMEETQQDQPGIFHLLAARPVEIDFEEEVKKQKAEFRERLDLVQKRQKVAPPELCKNDPDVDELLNLTAAFDKESPQWEDFQKAVSWPFFSWRSGLFNLTHVKMLEATGGQMKGHFAELEDFRQSELEFALRWARSGSTHASLMHGCWSTGGEFRRSPDPRSIGPEGTCSTLLAARNPP
eukprot:symbB.v1.2.001038.t1/scaffold56.1/size371842/9